MRWTCSTAIPEVRVAFPGPPASVYRYLTDPRHRTQWQSSLRDIRRLTITADGSPGSAGTAWHDVTMVPGVTPRMEVTVDDPPYRWTEIGQWGAVDAALTLTFIEADGDGGEPDTTDVVAEARLTVPVLLRPLIPVLNRIVAPALAVDLRRAARLLDAGAGQSAAAVE